MLSPSTREATLSDTPTRPNVAIAATGSVGATIAPSTNASVHPISGITASATTATAVIVASVSPITSAESGPASARSSWGPA